MTLGISTYAYQWRTDLTAERPWSLLDILDDARRLGLGLVQVCDWAPLERMSDPELGALRAAADERGLGLETGTKGIAPAHLLRHLSIAEKLGTRLLRSMLHTPDYRPDPDQAEADLRAVLPEFERRGISLALETYEQVPTRTLVGIVDALDSPNLGVCLDPGNVVASLEHPADTIRITAHRVLNVHLKDFAFRRSPDMVGFRFAGVRMGEGLLDYDGLIGAIRPEERGVNRIIEQWCPWQGSSGETIRVETEWAEHAVRWLQTRAE